MYAFIQATVQTHRWKVHPGDREKKKFRLGSVMQLGLYVDVSVLSVELRKNS